MIEPVGRVRLFAPYLLSAGSQGRVARHQPAPADAATSPTVDVLSPGQTAWQATPLTPARVARHLAEGDEVEDAGRFTSLAIGPAPEEGDEGFVLFFTWRSQGAGPTLIVLGRWESRTDELRIDADTATIADAAGIGASPVLLEVRCYLSGGRLLTLVRDFDRARLFSRSVDDVGLGRLVAVEGEAPPLRRDDLVIVSDRVGGLLVTDLAAGTAWQIDRDGQTRTVAQFASLPQLISNVAPLDKTAEGEIGTIIAFAANTAPRPGRSWRGNLPAGVRFDPGNPDQPRDVIGRGGIMNPANLSIHALSFENLMPASEGSVVGVDPLTGRIIRLRLREPAGAEPTDRAVPRPAARGAVQRTPFASRKRMIRPARR